MMIHTHTHTGILFSHENEGNPTYLGQHGWTLKALCSVKYARQKKTNTAWDHLYEESK